MSEAVAYELVEAKAGESFHEDHWGIKIKEGDYEGVVYQYDTVKISEEQDEDGNVNLSFDTITVDNPNDLDLTDEAFVSTIGDILVKIIAEQIEADTKESND